MSFLLLSGGLVGCGGSESATSGDSDQLFDEMQPSRLDQYTPSGVPYDTIYAPPDVDAHLTLDGGVETLYRRVNYPDEAKRRGLSGKVWVGFIVAPDGDPTHVQVVKPAHPILDKAARRAVTDVRFSPGTVAGSPVPVKGVVPLTFKLRSFPASSAPPND